MRDLIYAALAKAIAQGTASLQCESKKEALRLRASAYHHRRAYALQDSRAMDVTMSPWESKVKFSYQPKQKVTLT